MSTQKQRLTVSTLAVIVLTASWFVIRILNPPLSSWSLVVGFVLGITCGMFVAGWITIIDEEAKRERRHKYVASLRSQVQKKDSIEDEVRKESI